MTRPAWVLLALGLGIVLCTAAALQAQPPGSHGQLDDAEMRHYITWTLVAGALLAAAVWLVRARPMPGWTTPAIVAIGVTARLLVLAAPPILSTDIYRYVWDGRVQAAGINPYLYVPADPALAHLRDAGEGPADIYGNINRADFAPTIYPPAAQALFALMGIAAPGIWAMKAVMLAFDLLAIGVGLAWLRVARLPSAWIVVWAWHPLVIWEFANAGHIEAASVAVSGLALVAAVRLRRGWAGTALGVAVLLKLLPAALFPALWRRWDLRAPLAAAAVIAAGYACYAGAGWKVLGYLSGYAAEEGAKGNYLFQVLRWFGPLPGWAEKAYAVAGLAVLGGVAGWVGLRRGWPNEEAARATVIARDALALSAALMAVLSPHYPWYLTALVLPAVVFPSWAALWPTVAAPLMYFDWDLWVALPAVPLVALELYYRRTRNPAPLR